MAETGWILHVDLDQFIAAVEVLRHPDLAGRPVVVGGRGDPTERGVVATASYEARALGVSSGMPLRIAARKAPHAVFLRVDHPAYEAVSEQVMTTLRDTGSPVEVLGWDEAFIGFNGADPEGMARTVQTSVLERTGLHCSIGIGDNTIRAKIGTGFAKPRGVFRLTRQNWAEVMGPRPTIELWGIGPKISKRLATLGIGTVDELAGADVEALIGEFGPRMGRWYADLGHGRGRATVADTAWVARGHSREETYQRNLTDVEQIRAAVTELAERLARDFAAQDRAVRRVTLKVRYAPFVTKTFSKTLRPASTDPNDLRGTAEQLVDRLEPGREVRLLGLHGELVMPEGQQGRRDSTPVRGRL